MTAYVAIAGILALAAYGGYLLDSSHRRRERNTDRREAAWLAERRDLINRLMYMAQKPWEGPPELAPYEEPYQPPEVIDPLLEAVSDASSY